MTKVSQTMLDEIDQAGLKAVAELYKLTPRGCVKTPIDMELVNRVHQEACQQKANELNICEQINKDILNDDDERDKVMREYHVTLGDMIDFLEVKVAKYDDISVRFDWLGHETTRWYYPSQPHSHRGWQSHISFVPSVKPMLAKDLIKICKDLIGQEVMRYRGEIIIPTRDTPLWTSHFETNRETRAIIHWREDSVGDIILITKEVV